MIKVFCNSCKEFIKNAEKNEISELTGNEICSKCANHASEMLSHIDKAVNRATHQLNQIAGKAKAEIEEAKRRVIDGGN